MSAMVSSGDAMSAIGAASAASASAEANTEVVSATCECCGLTEECTPEYVARVRGRFSGRWVCGLCGEAIKDEIYRDGRIISTEEALSRHLSFSESFRSASPPMDTAENLVAAWRHLLRRSLDSPRATMSTPSSPLRGEAAAGRSPAGGGSSHSLLRTRSEDNFLL